MGSWWIKKKEKKKMPHNSQLHRTLGLVVVLHGSGILPKGRKEKKRVKITFETSFYIYIRFKFVTKNVYIVKRWIRKVNKFLEHIYMKTFVH